MAKEYIEREALIQAFLDDIDLGNQLRYSDTEELIKNVPAADVVEVVHGRWMPTPEYDSCWCSRCKKQYTGFFASDWNYCPNCGARMDGE